MTPKPVTWHPRVVPSRASELSLQGYQRRTTASEPRLSEIVAEYRRIGFEVQVLPHRADPGQCSVCFEDEALTAAGSMDVYVRRAGAGDDTVA